jgi:hypothetical protein
MTSKVECLKVFYAHPNLTLKQKKDKTRKP